MSGHRGVIVALGGNAIIKEGERGTVPQQFEHTLATMRFVASMIEAGEQRLVVTHGNGPQMGSMMLRSELATSVLPPLPMATCVADLQGGMGYMIQQTLVKALGERGLSRTVTTVVTQVEIDPEDPGFQKPTKPIGRFMTEAEAKTAASERGWLVGADSNRGWRRMVASPRPRRVVELEAVRALLDAGVVPVAVGGGGIPVLRRAEGVYEGVDAVIDKDLASALLGAELGARLLVILTGVDEVQIGYGKPHARALRETNIAEMKRHIAAGEFAPGSMLPKVEAAVLFLERGGGEVIITSPERCLEGLRGERGTRVRA